MGQVWIRCKQDPDVTREVPERDGNILVKLGRWEYMTAAHEAGPPQPEPRRKRGRPRKVKAE